jgi:hypothetical protein
MEMDIVEHGQTRIPEQVGPLIIMMRRITELVHGQVVWMPLVEPNEIVRGSDAVRGRDDRLVDKYIDLVLMTQRSNELSTARGNARANGWHRTEPG